MIDFRYHVVSIIAVFLALALGLFVGSTSLQDAVVHTIDSKANSVAKKYDAAEVQLHQTQNLLKANQNFDKALLPYAVSGRLSGQLVSVISAPGTSDGVRKQVMTSIAAAGGTVSADIRLQSVIGDPKQAAFLEALAARITVPGTSGTTKAASSAGLVAAQLAAVLGTRPGAHPVPDATVATVLAAYTAAKVVSLGSDVATPRPGSLALVLGATAPPTSADPTLVTAQQDAVLSLAADLDDSAVGAVLAAPTPAQSATTDITAAAAAQSGLTQKLSTVTGVETPTGQIAAVFALAGQADGIAGRYGLSPQVSPLPTATTSPTP